MAKSEEQGDRIVLELDPGGPIELTGLSESFAALARYYERHTGIEQTAEFAPKLFITRLSTGSVVAEIAPYVVLLGQAYVAMDRSVTVGEFTHRFVSALRAFSDPYARLAPESGQAVHDILPPTRDDAADLREFMRPLTGKRGASLGISHARFRVTDGEREIVAEVTFSEAEINRAAANIEKTLAAPLLLVPDEEVPQKRFYQEVMLFFQQASRSPAKEKGRTGDRAVVPDISDEPLPTYFRKGFNDLKEKMVRGADNPFSKAFIVDVHVQIVEGEPKAYLVTDVHEVMDLDEDNND